MSIRPSYFLIEVVSNEFSSSSASSSSSSAPSNDPSERNEIVQMKTFFVVHLMQIITNRINEIYNDLVSFRKDAKTILKGRVVAASTTRDYIEYKKRKLLHEQKNALIYNHNFFQYFLIKYHRNLRDQIEEEVHQMNRNAIMFTIVPQNRVGWITNGQLSGPLHLDTGNYEANILFAHDSEEFLLNELQKLKQFCALSSYSEIISGNSCENKAMRGENAVEAESVWLLVQYCLRPTHVAYDIVNYNQTIYRQQNPHQDLLAYLPYGDDIIHSIIIRRSFVRSELEQKLRHIEEFLLDLDFPMKEMTPIKNEMETRTNDTNGSNGMDYTEASPAASSVMNSTLNGSTTVATNTA